MIFPHIALLYVAPFLAVTSTTAASLATAYPPSSSNTVNLRIEGQNTTYFEGLIKSGPRNITLKDTQLDEYNPLPRHCDGLPDNPKPGNTPTCALDAAAKAVGFTYDGDYDDDISDYYISRISTSDADANNDYFWGTLVNWQVSQFPEHLTLSGCQQEVNAGDHILWAFINQTSGVDDIYIYLNLVPTAVTIKKGNGFVVTVTDGPTGAPVKDASVDGVHTDANGKATLYLFHTGFYQFKAHQTGSIRSNVMNVTVTD